MMDTNDTNRLMSAKTEIGQHGRRGSAIVNHSTTIANTFDRSGFENQPRKSGSISLTQSMPGFRIAELKERIQSSNISGM